MRSGPMQTAQWFSLATYVASAGVFTAAALTCSRWARWVKGLVLGLVYAAILLVASLELPITQLPFWSRDFSLTWTMAVLAIAVATVYLSPWSLASTRKRSRHSLGAFKPAGSIATQQAEGVQERGIEATSQSTLTSPAGATPFGMGRTASAVRNGLICVALGLILASLYWRGAEQNLIRVNTDPRQRDQNANIGYAEDLLNEQYSHVAGRNRMPLYPFLLSFALNPADVREVAFTRAKYFSMGLSLALLLALGVLFFRSFSTVEAGALLLITGFSLYVFRAAYVQPELLYYTLSAFLFVLMLRYLVRPSLGMAVAIGVLAGLAHLTKASVLPGLVVFGIVALGFGLGRVLRNARIARTRVSAPALVPSAVHLALVGAFFLLTVFPYIKNSWYRFGRPFYNVNSTFYVWYDSWEEAELGTKAYGDRSGWPDMPPDQIPSLEKYFREHSAAEIAGRLLYGASMTLREAVGSYGYAKYVLLLGLALAAASALDPRALKDVLSRHGQAVVFACLFFGAYAVLFAWFAQIASGNRLVLALLVPLLLSLAYGIRLVLRDRTVRCFGRFVRLLDLTYALLLVVILADTWVVVTDRVFTTFGGS